LIPLGVTLIECREQAIDEGGIGTMADLEERRYTPGKPEPNHIEFICAVGSDLWLSNLMWTGDISKKYGDSETKVGQIQPYIKYFSTFHGHCLQPHILYIDARWGSLDLMKMIDEARLYGVLSVSAGAKPQILMKWMREGLKKGDWWCVGWKEAHANLVTIHTKKKVFLNILTNYGSVAATPMEKKRRKPPMETYIVSAPWVQKNYNKFKCAVDNWNKVSRGYAHKSQFVNEDIMYTQFFIHAFTVQCWIYWQACTGQKESQLIFRKALIQEMLERIESRRNLLPLPPKAGHWPVHSNVGAKHCQYCSTRSMTTHFCPACKKWGCLPCLQKAHGFE
jgi:hypothetical protein